MLSVPVFVFGCLVWSLLLLDQHIDRAAACVQTAEGILCIAMGLAKSSLGATIALMLFFSIFCQASCGASFGVVPFVSKRSMGIVSGMVGAGGNSGAVITQTIFFTGSKYNTDEGLVWMGVMIVAVTLLVVPMYFPMWGGMFFKRKEDADEEDYYMGEYSAEERAAGLADNALKFANESKSQRGMKVLNAQGDEKAVKTVKDVTLP